MSFAFPRNWLRDVHERDVSDRNHYESFHPCHCGNVQRYELVIGEREFIEIPSVEKPILGRLHSTQYGVALWNPIHSVVYGKST